MRPGFDPWVRKIPGEGHGNALQYSSVENSMDRGAQQSTVRGVAELDTAERLTGSVYLFIWLCHVLVAAHRILAASRGILFAVHSL